MPFMLSVAVCISVKLCYDNNRLYAWISFCLIAAILNSNPLISLNYHLLYKTSFTTRTTLTTREQSDVTYVMFLCKNVFNNRLIVFYGTVRIFMISHIHFWHCCCLKYQYNMYGIFYFFCGETPHYFTMCIVNLRQKLTARTVLRYEPYRLLFFFQIPPFLLYKT